MTGMEASMELELRRSELGIIRTIYEEEYDNDGDGDADKDSSPPTVDPLSLATGRDPDVAILVQDSCFRLDKEALIARSTYLNRHLSKFTEITLSPPLNIAPETFSLVADFCIGNDVALTPFNVAALRTAAELLGMTEIGFDGDENLKQKTEAYFCRAVNDNIESACIVLRACFPLLPEAETAAFLVSRCLEALSSMTEGDFDLGCLDDVKSLAVEDLRVILESTSQRLTNSHDLLYSIIDIYLKDNDKKLSEDQKFQICSYMDSRILSPKSLARAVQNPRISLRFILQTMFLQQLANRRSIIPAADFRTHHDEDPITHRGAGVGQVSQLNAVVTDTSFRIQTLEREVSRLRELLYEPDGLSNRIDSGRSASFRLGSDSNKVERGQIGSISSLNVREFTKKQIREEGWSNSTESSIGNLTAETTFGRRVFRALKNAFGLRKKKRDRSKE